MGERDALRVGFVQVHSSIADREGCNDGRGGPPVIAVVSINPTCRVKSSGRTAGALHLRFLAVKGFLSTVHSNRLGGGTME